MLVPLRPMYHIPQTPNLTHIDVCLYPYCTPAVMSQPNEPAGAAADPLQL